MWPIITNVKPDRDASDKRHQGAKKTKRIVRLVKAMRDFVAKERCIILGDICRAFMSPTAWQPTSSKMA